VDLGVCRLHSINKKTSQATSSQRRLAHSCKSRARYAWCVLCLCGVLAVVSSVPHREIHTVTCGQTLEETNKAFQGACDAYTSLAKAFGAKRPKLSQAGETMDLLLEFVKGIVVRSL